MESIYQYPLSLSPLSLSLSLLSLSLSLSLSLYMCVWVWACVRIYMLKGCSINLPSPSNFCEFVMKYMFCKLTKLYVYEGFEVTQYYCKFPYQSDILLDIEK